MTSSRERALAEYEEFKRSLDESEEQGYESQLAEAEAKLLELKQQCSALESELRKAAATKPGTLSSLLDYVTEKAKGAVRGAKRLIQVANVSGGDKGTMEGLNSSELKFHNDLQQLQEDMAHQNAVVKELRLKVSQLEHARHRESKLLKQLFKQYGGFSMATESDEGQPADLIHQLSRTVSRLATDSRTLLQVQGDLVRAMKELRLAGKYSKELGHLLYGIGGFCQITTTIDGAPYDEMLDGPRDRNKLIQEFQALAENILNHIKIAEELHLERPLDLTNNEKVKLLEVFKSEVGTKWQSPVWLCASWEELVALEGVINGVIATLELEYKEIKEKVQHQQEELQATKQQLDKSRSQALLRMLHWRSFKKSTSTLGNQTKQKMTTIDSGEPIPAEPTGDAGSEEDSDDMDGDNDQAGAEDMYKFGGFEFCHDCAVLDYCIDVGIDGKKQVVFDPRAC